MVFSSSVIAQSRYLEKVHAKKRKQLMSVYDQISPPMSQSDKGKVHFTSSLISAPSVIFWCCLFSLCMSSGFIHVTPFCSTSFLYIAE